MPEAMKQINSKLEKGSLLDTDELEDYVCLIYNGWEELRDGFQIFDIMSLAASIARAYAGNKVAFAQALDLQDAEIIRMVDMSDDYELGDSADEARQMVKWLLVSVQTYDKLIYEKRKRESSDASS